MLLLVTVLLAVPIAAPAGATSCVMIEDGTPQSIVTGTEKLWFDEGFFEVFDYAVAGVVTDVVSEDDGRTEVTVDVINGYGVEQVPAEVTFEMPDPGWMIGYNFTPGRVYFIPLSNDPERSPTICDPISQMTLADAEALVDIATVAVAEPVTDTPPAPIAAPETPETPEPPAGPTGIVWGAALAVTLGAVVVSALTIRRRRNSPTT